MSDATQPDIVLFDGDCGICNETRIWLQKRDTANRLKFIPYQAADFASLSPGLPHSGTESHAGFRATWWQRIIRAILYPKGVAPQRLTMEMASKAAYFLRADGWRAGGARAIFLCLSRLPGLWGVLGRVGTWLPISLICEPFYRLVAENRSRISGWLGLNYCMVQGVPKRM